MKKAAFLDRDGVINVDYGYIDHYEKFEYTKGATQALAKLHQLGYVLIIVTNQSGIARGYFGIDDYELLTNQMLSELAGLGIQIQGVYYCPHHPNGTVAQFAVNCDCRKPKSGMLLKAIQDHNIDVQQSILIGDKCSDIQAARSAGISLSYYIAANADKALNLPCSPDGIFETLSDCVDKLAESNLDEV